MNRHLIHLATLIAARPHDLIRPWREAACKLPRAQHLPEPLLLDHMPQMLREVSSALTEAQSLSIVEMRAHKSAAQHGAIRFRLGFDVEEVIAEFGLLRDVIQQFAEHHGVNISSEVNRTVNRVIDKAIAVSLQTYVQQKADEVERKRQQYLSFIVHDLKTPISAIATAAYVIEQKLTDTIQSSATSKMVGIVRRNATQLSNRVLEIINEESRLRALTADVLELPLDVRSIDLWPMAERLKQDCQSIAEARRNTIRNEVPHDLRISADPDLLLELLQNLVSNALKYTRSGEIVIGGTENADSVACWVRDTGVGIPPDRIDRIFDRRTGDPDVPESTGLGLTIVAKVMQLHGGAISVDSTPGVGTTFLMKFLKSHSKAA
jgi:two-component system phosphate regulon sensor histidine kinase PhoR